MWQHVSFKTDTVVDVDGLLRDYLVWPAVELGIEQGINGWG